MISTKGALMYFNDTHGEIPGYPFKLIILLRSSSETDREQAQISGTSSDTAVYVCGKTMKALENFLKVNNIVTHPRFIKYELINKKPQ